MSETRKQGVKISCFFSCLFLNIQEAAVERKTLYLTRKVGLNFECHTNYSRSSKTLLVETKT